MVQIASLEIADDTGDLLARVARRRGQSVDDVVRALLGLSEPPATSGAAVDFEQVWQRICDLAGTDFATRKGQRFTYEIEGSYVAPSTSDVRIPMSQFRKALGAWPVRGPSSLRGIFAPSIVWAVLNDRRVVSDIPTASKPSQNGHRGAVDAGPGDRHHNGHVRPERSVAPAAPARPSDRDVAAESADIHGETAVRLYPANAHVWAIAPAATDGEAPTEAGPVEVTPVEAAPVEAGPVEVGPDVLRPEPTPSAGYAGDDPVTEVPFSVFSSVIGHLTSAGVLETQRLELRRQDGENKRAVRRSEAGSGATLQDPGTADSAQTTREPAREKRTLFRRFFGGSGS